MLQLVGYCYYN